MNHLVIPTKLIKLCKMTLTETCSAVRVAKTESSSFKVQKGFRQGDAILRLVQHLPGDDNP